MGKFHRQYRDQHPSRQIVGSAKSLLEICDPESGLCATPEAWDKLNPSVDGPPRLRETLQPPEHPHSWEGVKKRGYGDDYADRMADAGVVKARDIWNMDIAARTSKDKLLGALRVTEVYLGPELKYQFRQLFVPENLAITMVTVGLWIGAHYTPAGWVADAIAIAAVSLAGIATAAQIVEAVVHIHAYFDIATSARTVGDLHRAGEHLAKFISIVGLDVFLSIVLRKPKVPVGRQRPTPLLHGQLPPGSKGRQRIHDVATTSGISAPAMWKFLGISQEFGVDIRIRPPRQGHGRLRTLGHPAKPEWAKMKTVDPELDHLIGGPLGDGVPFFKPKPPDAQLKATNPQLYQRAMKQYNQRMAEWKNPKLQAEVHKRQASGEITVRPDGQIIHTKTGKSYVADYDLYDIRQNGKPLLPSHPTYQAVKARMEGGSICIQHDCLFSWQPPPDLIGMKLGMMEAHSQTIPLIEFRFDGSVWRALDHTSFTGDGVSMNWGVGRGGHWGSDQ